MICEDVCNAAHVCKYAGCFKISCAALTKSGEGPEPALLLAEGAEPLIV